MSHQEKKKTYSRLPHQHDKANTQGWVKLLWNVERLLNTNYMAIFVISDVRRWIRKTFDSATPDTNIHW